LPVKGNHQPPCCSDDRWTARNRL